MSKFFILDYGVGNVLSIARSFEYHHVSISLSRSPKELLKASKIVLPGVGSFGAAIETLQSLELIETLTEIKIRKIPILGICLGMQLLFDKSYENGEFNGLGHIKGKIKSLKELKSKVPHIGWNSLEISSNKSEILKDITEKDYFYFIHSYHAICLKTQNIVAKTIYDNSEFNSVVQNENIYGCQFHPEKSGESGLKIIKNFIKL